MSQNKAKELKGVLNTLSGTILNIEVTKTGVLRVKKKYIKKK